MNDQPSRPTPPDPAADPTAPLAPTGRPAGFDPTSDRPYPATEPTAVQPPVSGPGEWPSQPAAAWGSPPPPAYGAPQSAPPNDASPTAQPGSSYGAQPGSSYGAQPGSSYGAQPGSSYGAQPGSSYGAQAGSSYGAQPDSSYGAQAASPYGAQPSTPYGAQPGSAYGNQPGTSYGAQPDSPYGAQPGSSYGAEPGAQAGSPYGAAYGAQPGAYPAPGMPSGPAPGSGGTSGFAIASLVFGLLGGVLLSVIFGIVALVQIKKRGQTGRGMAIAGLVLSGCWVLLIGVGIAVAVITDSGNDSTTAGGTNSGSVAVTTLKPGDCLNGITTGTGAIEDLPVISCALPHEGEVYAVFELPAGAWPGDTQVQQQAEKRCKSELDQYAAEPPATVEVLYLHPLRQSWSRDRGVTCVATDEKGATMGSIRD